MKQYNRNDLRLLGTALRRQRLALGYTQQQLADICELHRTYISFVELGKRNPIYTNLLRLARGLKTTVSELTRGIS